MNETVLTLADSIADLEGTARPDSNDLQKKLNLATQLAELNGEIASALKSERDALLGVKQTLEIVQAHLLSERDALQAQVEALKADAARYSALRDSGHLPPDECTRQVDAAIKGSDPRKALEQTK
jgi:hypothetical protein